MADSITVTGQAAESSSGPLVQPLGLDHANLHVRDCAASLRFYTDVLGLAVRAVMRRDAAGRPTFVELGAGEQTVFLMERPDYRPPAEPSARGLNHLCLLVRAAGPEQLQADLRARGVAIRGTRQGRNAQGQATFSVYVEDLDGHGIELEQVPASGS
jgi:catechol 2,3-dioxygenase-like lactoylglutathione lyase family enzyme